MFKNTNYTLLLVLFAFLSMVGCKTNIYSLDPCINSIDVTTEQAGNTKTITATVAFDGNIQFITAAPFNLAQPLNMQLKARSIKSSSECKAKEAEIKSKVYNFSGIVPSLPAGEYLLDAEKDFTKTN